MEVLRPKRDKRCRGSSKNDAIGAEAGKGTPVLKSRDSSGGDPFEVRQDRNFRNDEVACQEEAEER